MKYSHLHSISATGDEHRTCLEARGIEMPRSSLASTDAPWTIFAIGQRKQRNCWCSDPLVGHHLNGDTSRLHLEPVKAPPILIPTSSTVKVKCASFHDPSNSAGRDKRRKRCRNT